MRSRSTRRCSRPSRSGKGRHDRRRMLTQPGGAGEEAGDKAAEKVKEGLQAVSVAQAALPNLQAALAAGRAPSADDLAKLTNVAPSLSEAAGVLGLDPGRATIDDLKAEVAARESSVRLRPVLQRLAHANGPPAAAPGLATLADEAVSLAGKTAWSSTDEERALTLAHLVELADMAVGHPDDDQHILSLDADLRRALGPVAAPVVLAAVRGPVVLS